MKAKKTLAPGDLAVAWLLEYVDGHIQHVKRLVTILSRRAALFGSTVVDIRHCHVVPLGDTR